MKHTYLLVVSGMLFHTFLLGQTPIDDPTWELSWEDNFDSLNHDIWYVADNFDHFGGEPQVFLADNVLTANGRLRINIKEETYSCPTWAVEPNYHCVRQYNTGLPYAYTAGWIETKQAYNTQFGYIEASISFPYAKSFWPAFWTTLGGGVSNGTNAAEIDIAEMLGFLSPKYLTTNIHKTYPDDYGKKHKRPGYSWGDGSYHIYSMEWSPDKIIWYLDRAVIRVMPNHGIVDPIRLILSIGMNTRTPALHSSFPASMFVDYVRVYTLKQDCDTEINACTYALAQHDNRVKKRITLGGPGCSNVLHYGEKAYLRAREGIDIRGSFYVERGAELYLDVNDCYN